jgi:flagellar biogenesis protein FliO
VKSGSRIRTWSILSAIVLLAIVPQEVSAAPEVAAEQPPVAAKVEAPAPSETPDVGKKIVRRSPQKASAAQSRATTQTTTNRPATTAKGFSPTRVAISLGAVLVLILLLRLGAKKFFGLTGTTRATRAVQVLSRSALSPRQQLVVLRVGRRLLVVADGGAQISTLSEITDADEVAALLGQLQGDHEIRATKAFGNLFSKMRGTYEEQHHAEDEPQDAAPNAMHDDEPGNDRTVDETRKEMSGLMDRVRSLSQQFKSP